MLLIFLGSLEIINTIFPDKVPFVVLIGKNTEVELADKRLFVEFEDSPDANWIRLKQSVKILKKVCPDVEAWLVDQHLKSNIVWSSEHTGSYASFDFYSKQLIIYELICTLSEGEKATILAHEFRHSRQSWTKWVRCIILSAITGSYQDRILEEEAENFEREVHLAIFH